MKNSKFDRLFNMIMEEISDIENNNVQDEYDFSQDIIKEDEDGVKYFRNGASFNRYARYRYGYKNAAALWNDPAIVSKSGRYAIRFNEKLANEKFGQLTDADRANWKPKSHDDDYDEYGEEMNRQERQQEQMMDYIHSGAGLENYYADRDAGYLD